MILSEARLRQAAQEAKNQRKYESYAYHGMRFDEAATYDLFISHSFKDKDLVIGLYHLFTDAKYNVYIDWIDDRNLDRSNVTPTTAAIIRRRIAQSKGISYIATSNSTASKWCPWELGVGDGMHNRVCILPVMNVTTGFQGQEYLGLYPYLEYAPLYRQDRYDFWVIDPQDHNKYIILSEWLKGGNPTKH